MSQSISVVQQGRVQRVQRNPKHDWQVRHKPWQLQPICFAPVLPGETLKNVLFQARVVTDPIKNPLVGWWIEYYFFYVKHRDLAGAEDFMAMMTDPGHSMAGQVVAGAEPALYRNANKIDWQGQCLDAIVSNYFRAEGDAPPDVGGLPVVQINKETLFNSLMPAADVDAGAINVDLNADSTITTSEIERSMIQWEFLKANNLTDMSYEDFLRTYGVRVRPEEVNKPELLRYVRQWSYPVNTVEPTTGVPSSAVSWAISERVDKDRFFKEPGFLVGLTCCRPKVYFSLQRTAGINLMDNAYRWLPAIMRQEPATSLARLASNADSIVATTGNADFIIDVRDLLVYGDQFVNFDLATEGDGNHVALPSANLEKRYPGAADITALFQPGDDNGTPVPSPELVRQDGQARFSILGTQIDQTPVGSAMGMVL